MIEDRTAAEKTYPAIERAADRRGWRERGLEIPGTSMLARCKTSPTVAAGVWLKPYSCSAPRTKLYAQGLIVNQPARMRFGGGRGNAGRAGFGGKAIPEERDRAQSRWLVVLAGTLVTVMTVSALVLAYSRADRFPVFCVRSHRSQRCVCVCDVGAEGRHASGCCLWGNDLPAADLLDGGLSADRSGGRL